MIMCLTVIHDGCTNFLYLHLMIFGNSKDFLEIIFAGYKVRYNLFIKLGPAPNTALDKLDIKLNLLNL